MDGDPLFFDAPNSDYHLSDLSPCIGAGVMTADVPHQDIEDNPRPSPQDSAPDMGVYENSRGVPLTTIDLIAPNGGEVWRGGSSRNITWNIVGATVIHHIRLTYSINGGNTYPNTITEGTDNDGIHEWNPVPGINSATVRVKVIAEDSINNELISGTSDSNFTIDSTAPETNIASLTGTSVENGWYISDVTIKLSATDNLSGVAQTSYKINDEEWTSYPAEGVTLSGSDFYYRSEDNAGNVETEKSLEVKIDSSPPWVPVVIDDGAFTNSETQLHARWLSEAKSGISEYQYSIGTWQGGTDVLDWVSAGEDTEDTVTGLDLVNGQTCYFGVKARSNAGLWSDVGYSDGIAIDTSLEQKEVALHSGWNLISICLDPANTDMESLLISISGLYRSVWAYDALTTSWEQYVPAGPSSTLTTMKSGKGYLIDMVVPGTLTIIGRELTDTTIQLYGGWNCVGYNSTNPQPRVTAMSSLSGSYIAIYAYDSETGNWMSHIVGVPSIANNLDELKPSMGFWILMNQDDEWILQQ